MKRTLILLSTLLALAAFSNADSIPLTSGSNQPWLVTAHFVNRSGLPGLYTFEGATFTRVPEPGTIVLLGTGMLPILFVVRRRLSRIGFRKSA
jgi:hypothetical protein